MRPIPSSPLPWLAAVALVTLAAPAARSATCNVPTGGYPTIAAAVADPTCTTIQLAAGTITENVSLARSLTLQGAGSTSTTLAGSIAVSGAATVVVVSALRLDARLGDRDRLLLERPRRARRRPQLGHRPPRRRPAHPHRRLQLLLGRLRIGRPRPLERQADLRGQGSSGAGPGRQAPGSPGQGLFAHQRAVLPGSKLSQKSTGTLPKQ